MNTAEQYVQANKFHHDHGVMFREMPEKDAIRLVIKTRNDLPNETIWVPKSVCRWDMDKKTGDIHLYIEEWWYHRNEEKF